MESRIQMFGSRRAYPIAAIFALISLGFGLVGCSNSIGASPVGSLEVPERVSFQKIRVGSEDVSRLTLENVASSGGGPVVIENFQLRQGSDDDIEEFVPVNAESFPDSGESITIAPGEEKSWEIAYRPENAISDNGAVTFDVKNDPQLAGGEVIIPLVTRDMAPNINYEPGQTLNFDADVGERKVKFVKVTNTGWAPLNVEDVNVTGSPTFSVSYAKPAEVTCSVDRTIPFPRVSQDRNGDGQTEMVPKKAANVETISPSSRENMWPMDALKKSFEPQECFVFIVAFEPTDDTGQLGAIEIESNATPQKQEISLAGNSQRPCLELSSENVIDFGVTSVNSTTRQTVRVRNCRRRAEPLKVSGIKLVNKNGVFGLDPNSAPSDLTDGDPSSEISLSGDQQATFTLTARPDAKGQFGGSSCSKDSSPNAPALIVNSNDPTEPTKRVCLRVTGDDNACPSAVALAKLKSGSGQPRTDITSPPLKTVQFDGTQSSDNDGSIQRYEWTILERPQGSTARLVPNGGSPKPEMFLDIAGEYRVELKVFDDEGTVSCGEQAIVKIHAIPEEAIHVQLVWSTPADPDPTDDSGSDLDLHFLNPDPNRATGQWAWNKAPYDIFYDNKTEDWGAEGVASDNPSLDIDDTDGAGPENINLDNPPNTGTNPYKVGVYYFNTHGFEESYATVRIFIQGNLKKQYKNKYMADTYTFWHVADIGWPNKVIHDRNTIYPDGFPQ